MAAFNLVFSGFLLIFLIISSSNISSAFLPFAVALVTTLLAVAYLLESDFLSDFLSVFLPFSSSLSLSFLSDVSFISSDSESFYYLANFSFVFLKQSCIL